MIRIRSGPVNIRKDQKNVVETRKSNNLFIFFFAGLKRSLGPLLFEDEVPRSFKDSESDQDDVESVPLHGTEADELAKLFQRLGFSRLVKKSGPPTTTVS